MLPRDMKVVSVLLALVLIGCVVAYSPTPFRTDFHAEREGNVISYSYDSNYGAETHTTLIKTTGQYDIEEVVVYFDEGQLTSTSWDVLRERMDQLAIHLDDRGGISISYRTSDEILREIGSYDVRSTSILICSEYVSDTLYDGTLSSPLMGWLDRGGQIVNMFGCLGKYVSSSTGPTVIQGFSKLFTGIDDDSIFMDSDTQLYADIQDVDIQRSLGVYLNEYTYGVRTTSLPSCFAFGSHVDTGYSSGAMFGSLNGMVINFGITPNNPWVMQSVSQVIASGLDHGSEIMDHRSGHTYGDSGGEFVSDEANLAIYGYVGSTDATFGKRVMFVR